MTTVNRTDSPESGTVMRHTHFIAVNPRASSSLLSQGSLPLGAKILRSYTPRALLRRPLTVELQIVIFVVVVVVSNFRNNNNCCV